MKIKEINMGKHSDFKRVRHGAVPGDIPIEDKIAMREKKDDRPGSKGYRKQTNKVGERRLRHNSNRCLVKH